MPPRRHHRLPDPEQRQTYLVESESDTRDAYEACERSYGRTPFYADAKDVVPRVLTKLLKSLR